MIATMEPDETTRPQKATRQKRTDLPRDYAATRKSLIEKLSNWEDQRTWDEFYQTYWKLIYSVACKSGLPQDEAFDVVQETVLSVAKQWKRGQTYDPGKGSFKTWLMNLTRWRIADQYRKKNRNPAARNQAGGTPDGDGGFRGTATIDRMEGLNGVDEMDQLWEREWQQNLSEIALDRVKKKVSPKQFQIFDAYVVKGWEVQQVREQLGVSQTQVYLAKHRVSALLKKEIEALQKSDSEWQA